MPRPSHVCIPGPALRLPRAARLAAALDSGAPALAAWLADLEAAAPGLRASWLRPDGTVVDPGGCVRPCEVDWGAVPPPGTCRRRGVAERARSPRAASLGLDEVLAATPSGEGRPAGVLRLLVPAPLAVEPAAALDAARLAGALDRPARPAPGAARSDGEAAELAHDLRNQLTVALFELERLRAEPHLDEAALERVDAVEGVLADARALCSSDVDGGSRPPAAPRVHLRPLLVEHARRAPAMARRARRVRVRVRCAPALATHADPGNLARLVQNLVVNAVEASLDGGEVRLEAAPVADGRVALVVEDRGRGMSRADLERHFGAARGGASRDGNGLGTASVARLFASLALAAAVESAPGAGTRVTVELPGCLPEGRAVQALVDPDGARRERRRRELVRGGAVVWDTGAPARALAWLRAVRCERLWLARGTRAPELDALCRRADRLGVPVEVLRVGGSG